jgi:apolipoprotein N-acyltransferase
LSAVAFAVAMEPLRFRPAILFCWTPFVLAVTGAPWRKALALGLLHGLLVNAFGFHWLLPSLIRVGGFSVAGGCAVFLSLVVLQAGRSALIGILVALATRRGWPATLVFPLSLVAIEAIYPCVFPWCTGFLTSSVPAWMQLAELGGPLLLSAWLGVVHSGLARAYELVQDGRGRSALVLLGASLGVVLAVTVYGHFRVRAVRNAVEGAPLARIGVVQGNLTPERPERGNSLAHYRALTQALVESEPELDLVVWPETAIPYLVPMSGLGRFFSDTVARVPGQGVAARPLSTPLLAGAVLDRLESNARAGSAPRVVNAAVLADASSRVLGTYEKKLLVPIAESEFSPGERSAPLRLGIRTLGVSICYEDIWHRALRESVLDTRPNLLLNLTSDAWFGESAGASLHLAVASFRAVEHRRYLLKATTTGVTALVAPTGEVSWTLPPHRTATGVAEVRWLEGSTAYQRFGDWPWYGAVPLAALGAIIRRRRTTASYSAIR